MRPLLILFFVLICCSSYGQDQSKKYTLIKTVKRYEEIFGKKKLWKISETDSNSVAELSEPLKALATYYSGYAQSQCTFDDNGHIVCQLTTALKLGRQGSAKQVEVLKKWLPHDSIAQQMIKDSCFVRVPGSSVFSDFVFLQFQQHGDTVFINYQLNSYNHGSGSIKSHKDVALLKQHEIIFLKRQ